MAVNKPLQLKVTRHGEKAVVAIIGSASLNECDRLNEALEGLASARTPVIVLDLSAMDFICSLGLGAIISGHLKCRHHHGQIRLVDPTPCVRELLETTRLTKLFSIYDSVEAALR